MTGMPHNKRLELGAKLGTFTFLHYTKSAHGNMYGVFRCDFCAEERERVVSQVRTGYIKVCHCHSRARHGHARNRNSTSTYEAWSSMKKRCLCETHANYFNYGGRGITVCDRWMTFENFLADMGECPEGLTLDRVDNALGYSRENCRWTTMREQNNNRRGNTILQFKGRALTISQWSGETGIKDCTISERLRHGWGVERALSTPARKYASR